MADATLLNLVLWLPFAGMLLVAAIPKGNAGLVRQFTLATMVLQLVLALQVELLLQQRDVVALPAQARDRHDGLAGHVPAQHEHLGLVELAGIQELVPADVGAVDVGGEKDGCQMRRPSPMRSNPCAARVSGPSCWPS